MLRFKIGIALAGLFVAVGLAIVSTGGSTEAAGCNESVKAGGRVSAGASASYTMQFCSDPTHSLMGWVKWGKSYNPAQDLAVVVTSPSGVKFVFDDPLCSKQTFLLGGTLEEGTWTVEIVNTGERTASYDLQMAFG